MKKLPTLLEFVYYLRTEGSMPTDSSLSLPIVMTVTPPDPTHGASPVDWVRRVGTSALKLKEYNDVS